MDRVTNYYGIIVVYMHGTDLNEVSTAVMKHDSLKKFESLLNSRYAQLHIYSANTKKVK